MRRARVRHAQRRPAAPDTAGDALVELAFRGGRATPRGSCSARSGSPRTPPGSGSWRATPCASSTSRRRGRASSQVPLAGAWDGFVAALDGVRQLASGSRTPVYFELAAGDPFRIAAINVMLFATLVFAVVACVGVLRRLPRAYGAVGGAPRSCCRSPFPVTPQPLMSLPRFVAVLFPLFMWLAIVCEERRDDRSGCRRVRRRPRPVHRPVRELALDLMSAPQSRPARRPRHAGRAPAAGPAPSAAASRVRLRGERGARARPASWPRSPTTSTITSRGPTASGWSACATAAPRRCGARSSYPSSTTRPRGARCSARSSSGPTRTSLPALARAARARA